MFAHCPGHLLSKCKYITILAPRQEFYLESTAVPDDLVSVTEIAEILGVSRQRVNQLIKSYTDFPAPEAELAIGRVWRRYQIERWAGKHPRQPGRPAGKR